MNTDCLDSLTYNSKLVCELWCAYTTSVISKNLMLCAYDVISTGLFPRKAGVKHLLLPLALSEFVPLYPEKQP